jgi:hypothetical protein
MTDARRLSHELLIAIAACKYRESLVDANMPLRYVQKIRPRRFS